MTKKINKIEKLIDKLCPEGVEFKELNQLAVVSGAGVDKKINSDEKKIKLLNYMDIYRNRYIDSTTPNMEVTANDNKIIQCNVLKGDVFITPSSETLDDIGNSAVAIENIINTVYSYHIMRIRLLETNFITSVYLTYILESDYLQKQINKQAKGITRFGLTKTQWEKIKIPIPPLPIQEEIVKILDNFTELEAELEVELEARKKQYEHYRDEMLTFGDGEVELVTLDEISKNLDSKRKPVTRSARQKGKYPYYGASGIVDYVSDYIFDGNYLLISEDGANLLARKTPIAFPVSGKAWINNHAHILEFKNLIDQRYVEFYLNSIELNQYITGAAQPKLNKGNLNSIKIPFPEFEKREEIVNILDKFDAFVNDISIGLPAEIKARRQQYEYYREQLLTFKELEK